MFALRMQVVTHDGPSTVVLGVGGVRTGWGLPWPKHVWDVSSRRWKCGGRGLRDIGRADWPLWGGA
eukprot:2132177-Prymnesium_polylepis.2